MGALKVAAIPPAAPQATDNTTRRVGNRNNWPIVEPNALPICTMGPSRPVDPPEPMDSAAARILKKVVRGRILPPLCAGDERPRRA